MRALQREDRESSHVAPRNFRTRTHPFEDMTDTEFHARYRFTRDNFMKIVAMLDDDVGPICQRSHSLTTAQRLAIFLQVLASPGFQIQAGDAGGCSQSSVSRIVREMSDWFAENSNKFIAWPSQAELDETKRRIFERHRLPGICGFIDGSHIRIIAPSHNEDQYVNRKSYHSINIGAIVDDRYRFLWLSTRFPGRTHDARVWTSSAM